MLLKLCLLMTVCVALTSATCRTFSTVVYRLLRAGEDCNRGLEAKDTRAQKSVDDHVSNGSEENYVSQYISTTTELKKAKGWRDKYPWNRTRKIARITRNDVNNAGCTVYDLNVASVKNKYLTTNKAKNYARVMCEVVLKCSRPLNCVYV